MNTKGMTVQEKKDTILKVWDEVYIQEGVIEDCKNMIKYKQEQIRDAQQYMAKHPKDQQIRDECLDDIFNREIEIGDWWAQMIEPRKEKAKCLRDIKQLANQIPFEGGKF